MKLPCWELKLTQTEDWLPSLSRYSLCLKAVLHPQTDEFQFLFWPIGRVVASLRTGHWDDPTAEIVKFEVEDLLSVVQSFDGLDIYGWEFFDVNDGKGFIDWASRVSLDYRSGSDGLIHTLDLFQEGAERHLDLRIWFDELMLRNANGEEISWEEFVAGGERWWNGLNRGDERTQGFGIELLK